MLSPSHSSPRTVAPLSVLFVEGAKVKTNESAEATQLGRDIASIGARWSPVDVLKQHSHQARFGTGAYGDLGEAVAEVLAWVLIQTRGNLYCVLCLQQPRTSSP